MFMRFLFRSSNGKCLLISGTWIKWLCKGYPEDKTTMENKRWSKLTVLGLGTKQAGSRSSIFLDCSASMVNNLATNNLVVSNATNVLYLKKGMINWSFILPKIPLTKASWKQISRQRNGTNTHRTCSRDGSKWTKGRKREYIKGIIRSGLILPFTQLCAKIIEMSDLSRISTTSSNTESN